MSTNRTIDLTVKEAFPQPVAAAWRRALVTTSNTSRVKQLFDFYEVLLRTVGSYVILDYLRGPRNPQMDRSLSGLESPSHGHWVGFIREGLRAIRNREAPEPFLSEAIDWYFDRKEKPTDIARQLDDLVALRNKWFHNKLPSGEAANSKLAADVFDQLRTICDSLSWLRGYRLFRVQELRPQRGRRVHVKARASFYVGEDETPIPSSISVGANLIPDALYLASPCGERILEVTPFIRVEFDEREQARLFLIRETVKSKMLVLDNAASGSQVKVLVDTEVGPQPFDKWIDIADHAVLFVENDMPEAGLRAPDFGGAKGQIFGDGRFHVKGKLGEGGMAIVYHVMDDFRGEELALKVLRKDLSDDRIFQERFKREARTMKRVRHPNVLQVVDTGWLRDDGQLWLTMPIVLGGNLRDRLKESLPNADLAREWMTQMARAAVALHERQPPIVHRDIKPSNFLVDEDDTILLTDFGIAFQENQARLTRTMEQVGSTAFMSPEQAKGKEEMVGPPSDIYSLGVVFHEVLTGVEGAIKPGRGIPGELGDMVRAMTALEPDQRPSASEVLAVLDLGEEAARVAAEESARAEAEESARVAAEESARAEAEESARVAAEESARVAAEESARAEAEEAAQAADEREETTVVAAEQKDVSREAEPSDPLSGAAPVSHDPEATDAFEPAVYGGSGADHQLEGDGSAEPTEPPRRPGRLRYLLIAPFALLLVCGVGGGLINAISTAFTDSATAPSAKKAPPPPANKRAIRPGKGKKASAELAEKPSSEARLNAVLDELATAPSDSNIPEPPEDKARPATKLDRALGGGSTKPPAGPPSSSSAKTPAATPSEKTSPSAARSSTTKAATGSPIILGALDKSLIDAVIKRNMNQIRYCYQRELTTNPSMAGKVVVKFVISKTGAVSKASTKSSTLGNRTVEECINIRFKRFQFPEPQGGGIVIVSYPFIFTPG